MIELMKDEAVLRTLSIGEKLIGSFTVVLLGMGVTFLLLVILMTSINIMTKIFNKKKESMVVETSKQEPEVMAAESEEEGEELAAVIAAITMLECGSSFRIKNIIPLNVPSDWALAGRLEAIENTYKRKG